jgi:hypothetical protein
MLDIKNSFLRSLLEYYTTRGGGGELHVAP